jgi:hypothetical protein
MGQTIILAVLFVLTAGLFAAGFKFKEVKGSYDDVIHLRRWLWAGSAGLGFITVILTLFSTLVIVNATQVGVPVAFGHVGTPLDAGVHFVSPWVNVEEYPIRPLTVELAGDNKVIARTADAGQMSVELAARWRVEKQDAKQLYFQSRTGDLNAISDNIVLPNLRQAVGQVYSVTGNLDAISDRERVSEDIRKQLNKQLVPYGITVDAVQMRSVEPDANTAKTISLYASQQQATRIALEAQKTATIEAQRRLIEAKGLEAAGKSVANLTPSQLQVVCMQVWQQVITTGINKDIPVYTNPCSNSSSGLIVSTK